MEKDHLRRGEKPQGGQAIKLVFHGAALRLTAWLGEPAFAGCPSTWLRR
jgi:hypothetical protein